MSLDANLTLITGHSNNVFRLISEMGGKSTRMDEASTLSAPFELLIGSETSKKGTPLAVDRHLIQMRETQLVGTVPWAATVNLTFIVPRGATFATPTWAQDRFYQLSSLLFESIPGSADTPTITNLERVLRGEV